MYKILLCLCLLFNHKTRASTFYISNDGKDSNDGTSTYTPWKTLFKIQKEANEGKIKFGDSILFKRNETFIGKLKWMNIWGYQCNSGIKDHPIVFSSYGEGEKPIFQYPVDDNLKPEDRILFHFAGVDYIIIENIIITENIDKKGNKSNPANCGIAIYFGAMNEAICSQCKIINVEISKCGMGIVINGNQNQISNCIINDLYNLKSTKGINDSETIDDYGANAITITGNYNNIDHNIISGAWAESEDFGWNGGAIEFFNNCNHNKVVHNIIKDCAGLAEFGGLIANGSSVNNIFENNEIINCGTLIWCNLIGQFSMHISNIYFSKNNIIEDKESRFSGLKSGIGIKKKEIRSKIQSEKFLFDCNDETIIKNVFLVNDNKFYISTSLILVKNVEFNQFLLRVNHFFRP